MFPAHHKVTIKQDAVRDQKAIERSSVDVRARGIVDTARQTAKGKRHLLPIIPVVSAQAPFFGTGNSDLGRLAIIQVNMRIAFERATGPSKVDDCAYQFAA